MKTPFDRILPERFFLYGNLRKCVFFFTIKKILVMGEYYAVYIYGTCFLAYGRCNDRVCRLS